MRRTSLPSLFSAACGALVACADPATAPPRRGPPERDAASATAAAIGGIEPSVDGANPVVAWNAELLRIVRTPGAQPATVHPTRSFAMMHAAVYDAVTAIDRTHRPYLVRLAAPRDASEDAAAAAAAYGVLSALYPAFGAELQKLLGVTLARIPADGRRAAGVRVGETAAARVVALRHDDGAEAPPPPFVFDTTPGHYRATPPNFPAQPVFTHWGQVTPFVLPTPGRFRPPPPPALTSAAYRRAAAEVRAFGAAGGTAATADEVLTGRFWNGPIQNYWNEIAQTAARDRALSTAASARLFLLLDLAIADGVIAFYEAKYTYTVWRPVSAVRAGSADTADTAWLPLVGITPADPSYPGAHAVVSAAGAAVLREVLRTDRARLPVTSEVLPGVTRTFTTFGDAADEASRSRVYAGVHFTFDLTSGARLGRDVAGFVLRRVAAPVAGRTADSATVE